MTTAQYNSNDSLTPETKWTSFKKRNNLDELINMPIKAEEWFVIQISFRTQDPNIRQAQSWIRAKNYSWSTIHSVFKIRQSARFTAKIHSPCDFWGQIRRSENLFTPLLYTLKQTWPPSILNKASKIYTRPSSHFSKHYWLTRLYPRHSWEIKTTLKLHGFAYILYSMRF